MSNNWKYKRDRLAKLIKEVSDLGGGDDQKWLREYALEVINTWRDNLEEPIIACESIIAIHKGIKV